MKLRTFATALKRLIKSDTVAPRPPPAEDPAEMGTAYGLEASFPPLAAAPARKPGKKGAKPRR